VNVIEKKWAKYKPGHCWLSGVKVTKLFFLLRHCRRAKISYSVCLRKTFFQPSPIFVKDGSTQLLTVKLGYG